METDALPVLARMQDAGIRNDVERAKRLMENHAFSATTTTRIIAIPQTISPYNHFNATAALTVIGCVPLVIDTSKALHVERTIPTLRQKL